MPDPSPRPGPLPLSILDLSPVGAGSTPSAALRHSVELARWADGRDFVRYWVAEHHGMRGIAASAPEVLIGHLADRTQRIRIGAGGIMLPNHRPLKVVELFRVLEALHPGRIDLGVGRAPGTDQVTAAALRRDVGRNEDPTNLLAEVLAFERGGFPEDHPFARIRPMPDDVRLPPLWMLGSTTDGARIAATLGVGYAFAGHFNLQYAESALRLYRTMFDPSDDRAEPYAILALSVVCGRDHAHAAELARPLALAFLNRAKGRPGPFPTVEEARSATLSAAEEAQVQGYLADVVLGGPDEVRARIDALASDLGADEVMVTTNVPDHEERLASYERVAASFGTAPLGATVSERT